MKTWCKATVLLIVFLVLTQIVPYNTMTRIGLLLLAMATIDYFALAVKECFKEEP